MYYSYKAIKNYYYLVCTSWTATDRLTLCSIYGDQFLQLFYLLLAPWHSVLLQLLCS